MRDRTAGSAEAATGALGGRARLDIVGACERVREYGSMHGWHLVQRRIGGRIQSVLLNTRPVPESWLEGGGKPPKDKPDKASKPKKSGGGGNVSNTAVSTGTDHSCASTRTMREKGLLLVWRIH